MLVRNVRSNTLRGAAQSSNHIATRPLPDGEGLAFQSKHPTSGTLARRGSFATLMPGQPSERRALSAMCHEITLIDQTHVYAEVALSAAETESSSPLSPPFPVAMLIVATQPSERSRCHLMTRYLCMHTGTCKAVQ